MGILSNLFGKKTIHNYFYGTYSSAPRFDGDLYEQEIVRAIIDCIATHSAKSEAMHVIMDKDGRISEIKRNSPYVKLLNQAPNPIMSGFDMKYKLVSQLETATTAMCYVEWDVREKTKPKMMLPIQFSDSNFYEIPGQGYAVQFHDFSGKEVLVPAEDVVIIRKFYCKNDAFGDGNTPVYNALSVQKAADEGLLDAVSISNKVRGVYTTKKSMLDPKDAELNQKEFSRRFNEAAKDGGIIGIDSTEGFQQLNVSAWAVNAAQTKEIRENVLRFWRMNDHILTSDYTEEQWQAFYESIIEPILMQLGQAFTNICFSQNERDHGNRIIFSSNAMVNMSMNSKTQLVVNTRELGIFTPNEYREMFGYSPIAGGDVPRISQNYINEKGDDHNAV